MKLGYARVSTEDQTLDLQRPRLTAAGCEKLLRPLCHFSVPLSRTGQVGRIERTLFTLDWLDDPALRRQATAELNKGESRNALARAVCFHRLGRLRDRTLESQQHRAGGLNLVVAAIVLWNTAYMERAIRHLRAREEKTPNEPMPYLAPLGWQHINLTGDYIWTEPSRLDGDGFRPLTAPSARPTPMFLICPLSVVFCPFYFVTPEKDRVDLDFALQMGADWIALSFVQRPEDMEELRALGAT